MAGWSRWTGAGAGGRSTSAGRSRAEVRRNAAVRGNKRSLLADGDASTPAEAVELMTQLEAEMKSAAAELRFEEAALLRDEIAELRARPYRVEPGRAGRACHNPPGILT